MQWRHPATCGGTPQALEHDALSLGLSCTAGKLWRRSQDWQVTIQPQLAHVVECDVLSQDITCGGDVRPHAVELPGHMQWNGHVWWNTMDWQAAIQPQLMLWNAMHCCRRPHAVGNAMHSCKTSHVVETFGHMQWSTADWQVAIQPQLMLWNATHCCRRPHAVEFDALFLHKAFEHE